MNENEIFYKRYYNGSKSEKALKDFLTQIDKQDAIQRHLVIPELLPEIISYEMNDNEYFKGNDDYNVYISRHNRYTPAFLHRHDFFEIIYVLTGRCSQNIGNHRLEFQEGDVIYIAPGIFHTMEVFDDDSIIFNILLRKSTFHQMFQPMMKGHNILGIFFSEGLFKSQTIEYLIFHPNKHLIDFQMDVICLYKEHLYHDEYSDQMLIGMLTMLNAEMMRNHETTMESSYSININDSKQENFMVMSYIQNNVASVTLSDVADHFGFSISYCSRLIKSSTRYSFNSWKRIIRIRRAENLLLNTDQTISDIGYSLGYENPETFVRAFKKELHITPSQYRKQLRKN